MICVPLNKETTSDLLHSLDEVQAEADIVEIWFDSLKDFNEANLQKIFAQKKKPFLYKSLSNLENIKALSKFKLEYIDLDLKSSGDVIQETRKLHPKAKLILSFHDFEKTLSDDQLKGITAQMVKSGADIVKLATFANEFSDTIRMLSFLDHLKKDGQDAICICMGEEGKLSRATGHLLGNYLMYAPINKNDQTAEGQILLPELKKIQNLL